MDIYLISLNKDVMRREKLKLDFSVYYRNMFWIKAIDGRELPAKDYFFYANQYYREHRRLIAPSEVGCALSHIKAYKEFLKTDEEYCLIIEDDIIGGDQEISRIFKIIDEQQPDGLVLFGGQEGMPKDYWKYILAKKIKELYLISNFSKKFIMRTHCYVLNRATAKQLISLHELSFQVADRWSILLKNKKLYYIDIIKHPIDLVDSHIENERYQIYSIQHKIFKENYISGLYFKTLNRICNEIQSFILKLKGYKKIN